MRASRGKQEGEKIRVFELSAHRSECLKEVQTPELLIYA